MQRASRSLLLGLVVLAAVFSIGCVAGANAQVGTADVQGTVAGFWLGLWHGLIAPITFIVSLFDARVGVYEGHNSGGLYNFGFLLGASVVFGGSGHRARSRSVVACARS